MNKLNKITIQFLDEDGEVLVQGEAKDVWNAEGELQRLARAYQANYEKEEAEGDRAGYDNEAVRTSNSQL